MINISKLRISPVVSTSDIHRYYGASDSAFYVYLTVEQYYLSLEGYSEDAILEMLADGATILLVRK